MKYIQTRIACLVLSVLSACSSLGSKNVEPRRLHVTLVGSNRLNPGVNGDSRPVQSCIYIVRVADWVPMGSNDSSCAGRDQDGSVLAASRHVIAPNQVLQFWIEVPRTGEIWLLADADYAQRPPNYAPLRVRIDGQEVIHLAVLLERSGIYNASLPGPVPLALDAPVNINTNAVAVEPAPHATGIRRRR